MRKAKLWPHVVGLARLRALVIVAMFGAMSVVMFGAISSSVGQTDLADQIAKAETFVSIMKAYRSKELDNEVMQMMAGRLDDE